jgi:hypothetical protein
MESVLTNLAAWAVTTSGYWIRAWNVSGKKVNISLDKIMHCYISKSSRMSKYCTVPNTTRIAIPENTSGNTEQIQVQFFWLWCHVVSHHWRWRQHGYPTTTLHGVTAQKTGDGGNMDLWNVGILPQHYTASQPTRPQHESSPPRKPRKFNRWWTFRR